eukprot:CAMPEP_0179096422 /NCGR_PEP_ID=MMETSP0796-20121207/44326_1 /TAXON_ID=73915 /ORGANISM="Pyrodinium bahamense, Strain pbaha01" /LENGTH=602 /DNA_ID=CAMNT_0020794141 /DNA_START=87 /DNA_END=1895 /DNA_ORIENTATION=-
MQSGEVAAAARSPIGVAAATVAAAIVATLAAVAVAAVGATMPATMRPMGEALACGKPPCRPPALLRGRVPRAAREGGGPTVYDFAVVGGGAAGLMGSSIAASLGASTVLIDAGSEGGHLGGDCTNAGCIPSKALRAVAKLVADGRRAAVQGFVRGGGGGEPAVDMEAVRRHVAAARDAVRGRESVEAVEAAGVDVLLGRARFAGPHELDVALVGGGQRRISARRFLLAVGAGPAKPKLLGGLAETPHETYRTIFERNSLPGSLLVVGAGPVGCELAQAYARLGTNVTLLGPAALPREDKEVQAVVVRALEADGVHTLLPSRALSVARLAGGGVRALVEAGPGSAVTLEADALLVAAGRVPATGNLGLEDAGVVCDEYGVVVDGRLRSVTAKHVFAAGDCVSGNARQNSRYAHHAGWQGFQAVRNALLPWFLRGSAEIQVPRVTYTDPEVGVVGLTSAECEARYGPGRCQKLQIPNRLLDRNNGELDELGFVELRFTGPGGRLVGATAVSARGGELASELSLALSQGLRARDLARALRPFPSYGFAGHKLAVAAATSSLTELLGTLGPAGWALGRATAAGACARRLVQRLRGGGAARGRAAQD